jgi:hypothetical protein
MASACFEHYLLIFRRLCTNDTWYIACLLCQLAAPGLKLFNRITSLSRWFHYTDNSFPFAVLYSIYGAGISQLVQLLATGWTIRFRISEGTRGFMFSKSFKPALVPPSLLFNL